MKNFFQNMFPNFRKIKLGFRNFNENFYQNTIKNNRLFPIVVVSTIGFLLVVILAVMIHQGHNFSTTAQLQNQKSRVILHEINEMNDAIHKLSTTAQHSEEYKEALNNMSQTLAQLAKTAVTLNDLHAVSTQIQSMQNEVDNQLGDLKSEFSLTHKHYLDADALPFKVISIDVMDGQPFVSVEYQHLMTPLAVGDALAGWKVSYADYANSAVEFEKNPKDKNNEDNKKQYVKVVIQG